MSTISCFYFRLTNPPIGILILPRHCTCYRFLKKCLFWCLLISVPRRPVDHRILMDVLFFSRFVVECHVGEWFHSYLSGWTPILSTPSDTSDAVALICSVPQCSGVRPLQFIAYREDVEDELKLFLSRNTYMQLTLNCAHMCDSQRCCDVEKSRAMCKSNPSLVCFETGPTRPRQN